MKTGKLQKSLQAILILVIGFAASACNERMKFRILAEPQQSLTTPAPIPQDPIQPKPVDPPVVVPPPTPVTPPVVVPTPPPVVPPAPPPVIPPPIPQPVQDAGNCKGDSSTQLLSCMNCVVPLNPPLPPQFSEKGKSIIEIMTIGCSIPNKSAPKNYSPPTRQELIVRMNRLSPTLYPDSAMSGAQTKVIADLKNDAKFQQKIFGGLWYHPPYTNDFETYFGVSIDEAVKYICYNDKGLTPSHTAPLQSADFINCLFGIDAFNCKEKPEYIRANVYRDQLHDAMLESIAHPYVAPPQTPAKKCRWESFAGDYDLGGETVLARWLVSSFKVGIEIGNLAGKCESVSSLPTGSNKPRGIVKMSAYICK